MSAIWSGGEVGMGKKLPRNRSKTLLMCERKSVKKSKKWRRLLWMIPKLSGIKSIAWQSLQQGCRLDRFCKIAPFMIRNIYVLLTYLCIYLEILKHCVSRWDQPSKIVTLAAKNIWYQKLGGRLIFKSSAWKNWREFLREGCFSNSRSNLEGKR